MTRRWVVLSHFAVVSANYRVIGGVRRMDNDKIQIGVARLQHDYNPTDDYASEIEVRAVPSDFGIGEETIAIQLKCWHKWHGRITKVPPMDIPQNELLSKGFRENHGPTGLPNDRNSVQALFRWTKSVVPWIAVGRRLRELRRA